MDKWLKYLVGISAIIIAGCAAFFSITGLGILFAGASVSVMVMAGSLEYAKLVTATYLKQKWDTIKGFNKWYLTKGIAIEELANELKIPSRDLSFLINFHKNERYQDYINRLRIQHVTDQLKNKTTDTMTIEAIGNEAGFGSRSTFFAVFKKHMGCTPKEYLKKSEEQRIITEI